MEFEGLLWLFTAGVTLHNFEEALFLPAWSRHAGRWHRPVGVAEFRFAIVVLTLVLWICAVSVFLTPPKSVASSIYFGYVLAMVANVFLPHLAASLVLKRYMPGTATALLFNLPLGVVLLSQAIHLAYVEPGALLIAGLFVALILIASIPLLFWIGRKLFAAPTTT